MKNDNSTESSNECKPMLGDGYLNALKLHQGNDDLRPWMTKPFYIQDFAYATDAHSMIWLEKKLVEGLEICENERPTNVTGIIPESRNENLILDVEKIKEAISKIELVDDYDTIGENVKCSECDGDGEVEWEYESWTKDMDCPKCDGEGFESSDKQVLNGKKVIDKGYQINIKQSRFSVEMILKLLKTQELLKAKEIVLVYQIRPYSSSVFRIGEAEVLCMPMQTTSNDKVALTVA